MLVAAIILLFAQANFDLALPDYLSQIVNTGIQQSGVEDPVPVALRQSAMERLNLFLSEEDAAAVRASYTLIQPGSIEADNYIESYPLVADEAIFVLDDISQEERDALSAPLARSLLVVSVMEQVMANPEQAAEMLGGDNIDLSALPPGTDIFALLAQLPAAQRAELASGANEQFAALGESLINQTAVIQVKAEYEALGADIAQQQSSYILRIGAVMLGITLLSAVATICVSFLSAKIASGIGRDLRRDIFRKVESFSSAEFDKFPTASLITRATNDITQLQGVTVFLVRLAFYAPIMGVGGTIRAIGKGSDMWWTIAVAVIVLLGVIAVIITIALPKFRVMQKLIDRLNLVSRENLSGLLDSCLGK
jgi:ATP-binding cassette subfamily B protein